MLYVMRHGKTDWNVKKKLQGRTDIPLNEEGIKMAKNAAIEYKDINFDVCYCSPLMRAKQTARYFFEDRDVPIIFDDRLMEMSFGIYEGVENSFSDSDCPVNILFKDPVNYKGVPDGETFEQLYARTGDFLEKVALPDVKSGKDVIIIGHGAMNSCIISQVKNIPLENFWDNGIENCKLFKLL